MKVCGVEFMTNQPHTDIPGDRLEHNEGHHTPCLVWQTPGGRHSIYHNQH